MSFPSFPSDVPVQKLLVVDYNLLKAGDSTQAEILWKAATTWGFWYLKNHESEAYIEPMFKTGREALSLSFEEKMKYWHGNKGSSFGYRMAGQTYTDADGSTDVSEFLNISKDDAMAYPTVIHRTYPEAVNMRMADTVRPFIKSCLAASKTILRILNERLGLPEGTLAELHIPEKQCISESRCIKVPSVKRDTKIALGAHTDFGSLSFLANRLGGLQVLTPDEEGSDWKYVKPIPGYLICNIGDTLDILSCGILKSSLHRVVPPPGDQILLERWSLVYFARPNNDVLLTPLSNKSDLILAATKTSHLNNERYASGKTAAQWFVKKQLTHRTDLNREYEDIVAIGPKIA